MKKRKGYSWFPGHMRKAERRMRESLQLIDLVLWVLDARAPLASFNPIFWQIFTQTNTPFVFVLNKKDLAESNLTQQWLDYFSPHPAVSICSKSGKGPGPLRPILIRSREQIYKKLSRKGRHPRPLRLMVAGLPNTGKSSLLNRLSAKRVAQTGKQPGVTRGTQWLKAGEDWHILDTPGVMYPRIDNERQLAILSAIGCIDLKVIPQETAAGTLLHLLQRRGKLNAISSHFNTPFNTPQEAVECLSQWFSVRYNRPLDSTQASNWLLRCFAEGKFGRITLENPSDEKAGNFKVT